jgi:CubicO group peptidase (beta-lactamase class C family)
MYAGLAKVSLTAQPGTAWDYSNLGFALLAEAMQTVFKQPYEKLLADHIDAPLGMPHTALVSAGSDGPGTPIGYGRNGDQAPLNNNTWPAFNGAGAIRSSLADMTRYLTFAMSGTGEVGKLRPLLFSWQRFNKLDGSGSVEQGLAWQRIASFGNGVDVVWKDGDVPGFASYIAFSEKLGEGVVVLTNRQSCKVVRAGLCVLRAAGDAAGMAATRGPNCVF